MEEVHLRNAARDEYPVQYYATLCDKCTRHVLILAAVLNLVNNKQSTNFIIVPYTRLADPLIDTANRLRPLPEFFFFFYEGLPSIDMILALLQ